MANASKPSVADVLRRYAADYRAHHGVNRDQARALRHLTQCRTVALGGQLWGCGDCGSRRYRYHSCRHSHCPTCNAKPRDDWLQRMLDTQLPIGYSHVVFTVPHELLPLFADQPRPVYRLLLEVAWLVMHRYAKKHHGLKIAATLVLHTWGQRLTAHPHVHCLLPLGGLSLEKPTLDGTAWVTFDNPHTLVGSASLADRFRTLFLKRLRLLVKQGKLRLPPTTDCPLLAADGPLAKKRWIVNVQSPPDRCVGAEAALRYLAGYVRGTAIGNRRMVADDGEKVTFTVKDYRRGGERKNLTLPGTEFVRRFLLHILPFGFRRVRYRGFLATRVKKESLALIRAQLGVASCESRVVSSESPKEAAENFDTDTDDPRLESLLRPPRCATCGALEMVWIAELEPEVDWIRRRYSHFAIATRGAGFGVPPGFSRSRPP